VLIIGMGGSAIGGDLVATLAGLSSAVPIQVVRGYSAPPVDEDTLVIASSFSGETEETLTAFNGAIGRTEMLLAFASGGRLARLAPSLGYSLFDYHFDGPPRSALGYGFFPILAILARLGVLPEDAADVEATLNELDRCADDWRPDIPLASNAAKQLARRLHGKLPVIVGTGYLASAARRWAGQINENAKQWAFHAALPEIDHNLVLGFGGPEAREHLHVFLLDAVPLHERDRQRVVLTAQMLDEAGVTHDELLIGGRTPLDSLMRACYLVDWVSLYLAALNGVDPTPKDAIDRLKAALAHPH
jgi:glucose/mannose-6-phosphate isomerase